MNNSHFLIRILCAFWIIFSPTFIIASPYEAAKKGNLKALRQYRFEGIDLFIPDQRGFTPYELAALYADPSNSKEFKKQVEIMLWLKEYQPKRHKYDKSSVSLVQSGLNTLGYQAGQPDGIMGKKTIQAIKEYQVKHNLSVTGTLGPHWLGTFHRELLKDVQFKLTQMGYDTKGTDGIIGSYTQKAFLRFREDNNIENPNYKYLDYLIVKKIHDNYTKIQTKKEIASSQKELKDNKEKNQYIQSVLKLNGFNVGSIDGRIGSKTNNAIKAFQRKYNLKITGKVDNDTRKKLSSTISHASQRKLKALGYYKGKVDGAIGKNTQKSILAYKKGHGLSSKNYNIDNELLLSLATNDKKTYSTKAKQPKASVKTSSSSSYKKLQPVANQSTKGKMIFNRKNGLVVGCSINSHRIAIEWCEPFYPLPKNNYCEATLKSDGSVINLWCK